MTIKVFQSLTGFPGHSDRAERIVQAQRLSPVAFQSLTGFPGHSDNLKMRRPQTCNWIGFNP